MQVLGFLQSVADKNRRFHKLTIGRPGSVSAMAIFQQLGRSDRIKTNGLRNIDRSQTPATITQGMASHHLLPCCAASRPRMPDIPIDAKFIGYQFENGGTKMLPSRSALGNA